MGKITYTMTNGARYTHNNVNRGDFDGLAQELSDSKTPLTSILIDDERYTGMLFCAHIVTMRYYEC